MSDSFDFGAPDLFTAGTIGPPGQRVFYLQAREGDALMTLKCEKEQVRVLGQYLERLLERLSAPAAAATGDLALVEPATPAWVVGSIGVAYDEAADRVLLVIEEVSDDEDEDEDTEEQSDQEEQEEAEEAEAAAPAAMEIVAEPEEEEEGGRADRASGRIRLTRPQVVAFVERARTLVEAGRPTCRFCGRPMNPGGHRCARTNGHGSD
jgi:uncharacterized repeat protein (TIGR03847 family)